MIRGFYSAGSGLQAASLRQDVVAENLAHANVPGYRQLGVTFESFENAFNQALTPNDDGGQLGTIPSTSFVNFQPGPIEFTGNPLDFVAVGDTFFVLDSPGGPVYTKGGVFQLNAQGELVNTAGLRVRGEGGQITIPPNTTLIEVTADGFILADGQQIGRLQLERIANPAGLQRAGPALFLGAPPNNPPPTGEVSVQQGFREGANVQPVTAMVSMILAMRYYEAGQRALRTLSEAIGLNVRPQL